MPAAIAKATAAAKAAAKAARAAVAAVAARVQAANPGAAAAAPAAAEDQQPAAEADAQPLAAVPAAPVAPAGLVQEAAAAFSWPVIPAVAGIHDMLAEVGPGGPAGWTRNAAGTLACKWSCTRCGKKAGNSSRLLELLRKPCGELAAHCI